jgi:hypothetical protein
LSRRAKKGLAGSIRRARTVSVRNSYFFRRLSRQFLTRAKVNSALAEGKPHEVISMSIAIQSVQALNAQAQTQPASQAPKSTEAGTQSAAPQDKVTISPQAQQALAATKKPAT